MPVDPIIARGIEAPDLTRPLLLAEEIKNRRQYNKLLELDRQHRQNVFQAEQVQLQQQQTAEAEKQKQIDDMRRVYPLLEKGDALAEEYAFQNAPDEYKALRKRDPVKAKQALMQAMQQALGIEAPQAPPQQPSVVRQDGYSYLFGDKGVVPGSVQAPQRAPLVAPASPAGPAAAPEKPTVAQSAVDKSFAPEYVKFVTGGAADAEKALQELRAVNDALSSGKNLTGPLLGRIPLEGRAVVNQDSVDAEETVANTVQRSLRVILGAQFTQKEGEALIRRAYNPQLKEAKNRERLGRLITQLERALLAKQEAARYYEANGTLVGYEGKIDFSLGDFSPETGEGAAPVEAPAPGTRDGDYIFIGGDPADPKRWVKVRPEK